MTGPLYNARMPRTPPQGTPRVAALRLLGRRDYTRSEITDRLIARGYAADDVHAAVDALAADGTVDDRRTAFAHVRAAAAVKRRGRLRIIRELQARGLAADVVRDAMSQLSPDADREAIERLLLRRHVVRPLPVEQRRRLFQQLLRRGFPASAISAALSFDPADEE